MTYFPKEALNHHKKQNPSSLEGILTLFPVKLKRALYAVAEKGSIGARQWAPSGGKPGCALYQAGEQEGIGIQTVDMAALTFETSKTLISRFISKWDSFKMSPESRAKILKDALLAVGIMIPPSNSLAPGTLVFEETVYRSAQNEFIEALEAVETIEDLFPAEELEQADAMLTGVSQ